MAILRLGTKFRDFMQGTDEAERFAGFEGDDTINGGRGNDTITGGQGRDILNGDDGDDEIHGGTEDDTISGGNGNDKLFGDEGNDTFTSDIGSDVINGGAGIDTVDYTANRAYGIIRGYESGQYTGVDVNLQTSAGTGGDSYVSIESVIGSNYNDTITGSTDANFLSGANGGDIISGGANNDTLDGGNGNDTLSGDQGSDVMIGGAGADSFTFRADLSANANADYIKDFEVGIDHIVFNDFTDGHVVMQQVDGGTLVWAEDQDMRSDSVMLWNVDAANLSAHMDTTFLI